MLLVALALPQQPHSFAHFYLEIMKVDSKIIDELKQLPKVPQELLLPPPDVVDHRKANPRIVDLLQTDNHPEQMREYPSQLYEVVPLLKGRASFRLFIQSFEVRTN